MLRVTCCAAAVAAVGLAASTRPAVHLSRPLPALVRVDQRVNVSGRVGRGSRAALQLRHTKPWATVAAAPVRRRGGFAVRWRVPQGEQTGPVQLRVVALSHGRVVAETATRASAIGTAPAYCAPPVPPAVNISAGDGWIEGGVYVEGGAFPGVNECEQQPYTISAETPLGTVVASQQVAGGHSYTLVVPAGSYRLRANSCFGSATVTAAQGTSANTYCLVP